MLGLWHRYTLIVTPLATRNSCSGDGGDGGDGDGGGLMHFAISSDLSRRFVFSIMLSEC